jgi:hypothetical protein
MAGWTQPWAWRNGLLTTLALAFMAWLLMLAGVIALQSRCDTVYSNQARPWLPGARSLCALSLQYLDHVTYYALRTEPALCTKHVAVLAPNCLNWHQRYCRHAAVPVQDAPCVKLHRY